MSDNTTLNTGTGGDVIATDDIGGVKHQRVKMQIGADGAASDVHSGNPLPVSGTVAVSGTVPVSDAGGALSVDDNGASLTVDSAQLPTALVGGRLSVNVGAFGVIPQVAGADNHDSPVSSAPVLVGALGSTATPTPTSADGDVTQLRSTRTGELLVNVRDDAGDSCMDGDNDALRVNVVAGAAGGVSHTDDTEFTPAASSCVPAAGTYQATRDLVDDGDAGAFGMTIRRALYVSPETPLGQSLVDDDNDAVRVTGGVEKDASAANLAPVLVGARASNAAPVAVSADDDAVPLRADRLGQLVTRLADGDGHSCMDGDNDALRVTIVAGAGSGGTSQTDDEAFTPGTSGVTPMAGTYRASRDTLDDGDAGAVALTATRALYTTLETPDGDALVDDDADALKVSVYPSSSSLIVIQENGTSTGNIAGAGEQHLFPAVGRAGTIGVQVTGTWVATLQFEGSIDGSAYFAIQAYPAVDSGGVSVAVPVTSTTFNGTWFVRCAGLAGLRVRASAHTSGTATVIFKYNGHEWTPDPRVRASDGALITGDTGNGLDVDVTRVVPGTGATHLGKAEDAAAGDGDTGVAVLAVRRDSASSGVGADGDYAMLSVTSDGSLRVSGGGGGTQYVEDDAAAANPTGTALSLVRDDARSGSLTTTNGDNVAARGTNNGELYVKHVDAIPVTDGSGSLTVDSPQLPATLVGGRLDVVVGAALPAGNNNIGDVDVASLPALPAGSNNIGDVDVLTLPGIAGTAAHDAAVSGNPVLVGLEARTSAPTAVANGDAVRAHADSLGKQVVLPGAPHELDVRGNITRTNDTAADVIAAAGSGVKIVVTNLVITNHHATQATKVEIRSATTVLFIVSAAAAGGGVSLANPRGILKSAANEAITGRCVTTGADVEIFASGYTITNG